MLISKGKRFVANHVRDANNNRAMTVARSTFII